jgi:hypothetical protein
MTHSRSGLEDPRFLDRLGQLGAASDGLWAAALVIGLSFTLIAAYLFPYGESPSGKFWAYAGVLLRAGLYLGAKDGLRGRGGETLARLFALGVAAGLLELLVDWGLIHWVANGRLVYLSGNDVVLLGSPVWMPLAWACVITDQGYLALRLFGALRTRLGTRAAALAASALTGLGAGVTVGFYEYFAYRAGWWKYERANAMLGGFCALYVPLGELLMFLTILPIAARAVADEDRPLAAALLGGLRFALAIAAGYTLAYVFLEGGRGPGP